MAKKASAVLPPAQADLFGDPNRSAMSWSQIPQFAKARVLERLAQLLRASHGGPDNDRAEGGDE